ncbi:hypothetical protein [Aquibacillus rhizosphaerae]|uniref:Holin n=1 Tax=Aquibacillus rhizosphaerae TaxID=3051431 RepID=A0ABT7LAT2_9BACI|nr:hypothetical protein [Aquibacillus sp. LR5S19]MDL4842979.1 hypothetical protein [Aquibacillus sp. LR5S19]
MIDINQLDPANLATISAIVAALVTVIGNAFTVPKRYRSLLAIGFAMIIVFLPQLLLNKVLTALIIGLTASGVYSQIKPSKLLDNLNLKDTNTTTTTNNSSNSSNAENTATSGNNNNSNNNTSGTKNNADNKTKNKIRYY